MHKLPVHGPSNSLPSLSTTTGLIPKKGLDAKPGFKSITPYIGVIIIPYENIIKY